MRRLGIPFARGEIGLARRGQAINSYNHLMEVALTLTLRVYHVVPGTNDAINDTASTAGPAAAIAR